ncbi:transposase, partial [Peptoniphilus sp. AGMB00490]|nr:transposase [Peptoniphilus faecalis]
GTHTKIKTLKRNCFGMKNFNLFRKRIMFACK